MRSLKIMSALVVAVVATFGLASVAAGQALEDTTATSAPGPPPNFNVPMWDGPDALLYDNGPLVTHPGGGTGGADASAVQTALLLSTYGFGHAISTGFRVADDFTVAAGGWLINQVTFFAYQTGSTTTSTINNVNLRIWDGDPSAGGSVIWGDTTTNVLATTQWSNIYRVLDTDLLGSSRPIMADTVTVGTTLPAGTYWLDWQTGGTLSSGPWAPPISILGQTVTGNGLQYDPTTATWGPAIDTGASAQQGFPFIIEGTGATGPSIELTKTVGTVSGVCAANHTITVVAGTTVYYCYEVTNTGDVTLNLHDLSDDVLGTIFTGLAYELEPGTSVNTVAAGLSIPAVIDTTTTNTGTWTAYNAGGPSAQATASATVNVQVGGPSIELTKTVGTVGGVCAATSAITVDAGTRVYYCYEVTNTGDVTFTTHDLEDDTLGAPFTGLDYVLAPGASVNTVDLDLNILAIINTTTTNTGYWTAYVPGEVYAQASDSATVTVIPPHCPEGYDEVNLLSESFEGSFPPAGWAVSNSTTGCTGIPEWTNTDPGGRGNLTGGVGLFAIADSDSCGSGSVMNTEMRTPALDFTCLINPLVIYSTDYYDLSSTADLDLSTDGGGTWTNLLAWGGSSHRGPLQVEQAFTGAGLPNVMLRWHYVGESGWWWEVDDVVITACAPVVTPGPAPLGCGSPTVTFDAGPPTDWTVIDNVGSGLVWTTVAGSGEARNYTNDSCEAASASSNVFGTADYDTELRAPPFDTTGYTGMWLRFTANYQNHADADYLDVDVSTDGGATWTNVMSWNEDHGAFRSPPGEDVELDIMAVTGNQPSVIVRWHYYNPNTSPDWDWYVQIDNAALLCGIPVELMGISVE
jgi:hypothetical protein